MTIANGKWMKLLYDSNWKKIAPFYLECSVAQVNIIGGQEREIQVNLDATKMVWSHKYNKLF
jgi:HAE1 family hydrophobic/amphiphilic exporter-1